jgi:hypothetical protein
MLASGDFNYAVLGLLARNIENPRRFARSLVNLARSQFSGLERHHKLVHCITVAFLRGRAELIWSEVSTVEENNIVNDPFWPTFIKKVENSRKKLHLEIFRTFQELKERFGATMPEDFLDRAIHELEWADLEKIQHNMETARSLREVISRTPLSKKKPPDHDVENTYSMN